MSGNGIDERKPERISEAGTEGGQGQQAEAEKPPTPERSPFAVDERIQVPDLDHDLSPAELLAVMTRIAKVCNALVANLTYTAATTTKPFIAGIAHPVAQSIMNCAIHADSVRMGLEAEIAKQSGLVLASRDQAQKAAVPIRRQ